MDMNVIVVRMRYAGRRRLVCVCVRKGLYKHNS